MLTPSLPSSDDRGTRWLQAQVQQILADGAVEFAPPPLRATSPLGHGLGPAQPSIRLAGNQTDGAVLSPRHNHRCGSGTYSSSTTPSCSFVDTHKDGHLSA
jgi:hypothetical protein